MKRFIDYNSIPKFRQVVKDITHSAQFIGFDEDRGYPMLDKSVVLPTIDVVGYEKIHGSCAAVCYSEPDGFWVQSRKRIIDSAVNPDFTGSSDNAGCAFSAWSNKDAWMDIILTLADYHNIDLNTNIISVYYEWAGGNIQKLSALSGLDKCAMIFAYFKVSPIEPQPTTGRGRSEQEESAVWLSTNRVDDTKCGIYNIANYPTTSVTVNFNEPLLSQNKMIELVDVLESASTVGKAFGQENNIGEGYVFMFEYKDQVYRFKVKGEKHAGHSGHVKTLKPVDEVYEQKKIDFVNNIACISWRLEQMYSEVEDEFGEVTTRQIGDFLRKVINDVIKEESDLMAEQGLEPKTINSMVAKVARTYFMSRL